MSKRLGFLIVFVLSLSGFRWRRPKWMSKGRDWLKKRADSARRKRECKERKALQRMPAPVETKK